MPITTLDESAEGPSRKALLDTLAKGISGLPSNIHILITAHLERDIVNAFDRNQHVLFNYMNTTDDTSNEADITLFVERQLCDVKELELKWPKKEWCS